MQWQDAKDYCQWLGSKLNLPIDLVTDAQWEYAARSGGKEVLYANASDDFNQKPLIVDIFSKPNAVGMIDAKPVGTLSTPNRLGFYDMDTNGHEWTNDWFSASYGKYYPQTINPQGPATGTNKAARIGVFFVFYRYQGKPDDFASFRCTLNQPEPLNH